MIKKAKSILYYALPIMFMIGLIPLIKNDYVLAAIYLLCIALLLVFKREKHDLTVLIFGFVALTISESFFVSTGVEIFLRNSLFGLMPVWLPFLWAYAFVSIKRVMKILES